MRCIVLGANGFIGQHLVQRLLFEGLEVLTYGRGSRYRGRNYDNPDLRHIQGDFTYENRWANILRDVDVCYHLISTTTPKISNDEPIADVSNNLVGTLNLLEAAKALKIRIVFCSSGGTVYGNVQTQPIPEDYPTNPLCSYGITKLSIEKYLNLYHHLYGLESVSLRIANPFGPGQRSDSSQGAVAVFMGRVLAEQAVSIWGDGATIRDYIYIKDVINALFAASTYQGKEQIFNIGSGRATSLLELIREIERATGKAARVTFLPAREFDVASNVLDISLAKQELMWHPVNDFRSNLVTTALWHQQSST